VVDVMTTDASAKEIRIMTFNNIVAHATPDQAEAAVGAGPQAFSSQKQLAELAAAWPAARLVEIWNSLAGVEPVKKFKSAKAAASRIWARIQGLAAVSEPANPKAGRKAKGGGQAATGAPAKTKSGKKATPAKKAHKGAKGAKHVKASAHEGSKTAQVGRDAAAEGRRHPGRDHGEDGLAAHTVRGFVAGTMKKAGHSVESFKSEGGERTYRIAK
jgi:hypothetical protein